MFFPTAWTPCWYNTFLRHLGKYVKTCGSGYSEVFWCLCNMFLGSIRILCHPNGICLVDIPWFSEIHLSSRGNPPLDHLMVAPISSPPEWSLSIVVGHINHDPLILQQQTNTRRPPILTSDHEGSISILLFQIGIDIGMGKDDGDNRVMAFPAGGDRGGIGTIPFILPIDI